MAIIAKPISTQMSGGGSFVTAGGSGKLHNISPPAKKVMPNMIEAQPTTKPGLMKNGTTVTGQADVYGTELADTANKAYNNQVAIRDYATSKGYGGIVDWDGKNPTVGGNPIPMVRNENGTAYVDQTVADRALEQFENRSGITGNKQVVDNYKNSYKGDINAALDRITNREDYGWNSDNDEAFQRYKDFQEKQAEKAYRKVINSSTNFTGLSGATIGDALAAQANYLDKINSEYKDFEQKHYDRYLDDYDMRRNDLTDIVGVANDAYNREYQANRDAITDVRTSMLDERNEKWRQTEYNDNKRFSDVDYEQALLGLEGSRINNEGSLIRNKGLELQNESAKLGLDNDKFDLAIRQASQKGRFTPDDEMLIPWLADFRDGNGGYTIHPWENELLYERGLAYAQAAGQYQAYNEFNPR